MNVKSLLITGAAIIGFFFLAEWIMPGHTDRFSVYMEGNWNSLLEIFN